MLIPIATGASIHPQMLEKQRRLPITLYGALPTQSAVHNTAAINRAIADAARIGGATVVVPGGTYLVYTIVLQSNVNLYLAKDAVLQAAKPDDSIEGANYLEPEVNRYRGLQDHGHSYLANALIYGADLENIMIAGEGRLSGGAFDENGYLEYILRGDDPQEPLERTAHGHCGTWFGNKGIALMRCKNIVLKDFTFTIGGHFAIITTGCDNLYVDGILLDTNRDAFDIDCCQNVTVRNSVFNSLTDDALCLKASYGAGIFMPVKNVLIEDCTVSGYDAGSVYAGEYTQNKLVADDRCGPTGRVKFGTESTCGGECITIRRVRFERSRGFCLEAVDCAPLMDIILEDCTMDNISSSPIFLRAGDRGRYPVTGTRMEHPEWTLPDTPDYTPYPPKRRTPAYRRTHTVSVDGHSFFDIVDEKEPVCGYNDVGSEKLARLENVLIRNVRVTNVDPRYPILLMGLTDSQLRHITIENVSVEYRGGLTMEHAVEQRQLNTDWTYSQFHAKEAVQSLPWLVNDFFVKHEGLLPRADWDAERGCWQEDPYNVPELPDVYPESSNWGILPAYGIYVRHVDDLTLRNVTLTCKVPDTRHVCVLDDVDGVTIEGLSAQCEEQTAPIVAVTHHYRRHTNREYVPEEPYFTTGVAHVQAPNVQEIIVNAPAPGTPRDCLYTAPTVPCRETGYAYAVDTPDYPLPQTVFHFDA